MRIFLVLYFMLSVLSSSAQLTFECKPDQINIEKIISGSPKTGYPILPRDGYLFITTNYFNIKREISVPSQFAIVDSSFSGSDKRFTIRCMADAPGIYSGTVTVTITAGVGPTDSNRVRLSQSVSITAKVLPKPSLKFSASELNFQQVVGVPAASKEITLNIADLQDEVVVSAPYFNLSTDNINFQGPFSLPKTTPNGALKIYVKPNTSTPIGTGFLEARTEDRNVVNYSPVFDSVKLTVSEIARPEIKLINPPLSMITDQGTLTTSLVNFDFGTLPIKGVATDGVSKLLLAVKTSNTIKFSLPDDKNGTLSQLGDMGPGSSSVTILPVNNLAIAVYTAPDGYGLNNRSGSRDILVTAVNAANALSSTMAIRLETPPVVLVHGMWSSGSMAWESTGFKNYLVNNGINYIRLAEYGPASAQTFDPLSSGSKPARSAIARAIGEAKADALKDGIIATQVDVVGHSLGGLQLRSFNQQPEYLARENYYKGYYHKMITIGTSHLGTEWGPLANNFYLATLPLKNGQPTATLYPFGSEYMKELFGGPIGSVHADFEPDFKGSHKGIDNLAATRGTKVHAIGSYYDKEDAELWNRRILMFAKFFNKGPAEMISDILKDSKSDLVVPQYSQRGGLPDANYTEFPELTHSGIPVLKSVAQTQSKDVMKKVLDLLVTNDMSSFGSSFPAPNTLPTPFDKDKFTIVTPLSYDATFDVKITEPLSTQSYTNNGSDSVLLRYTVANPASISKAVFVLDKVGVVLAPTTAPYSVKAPVPQSVTAGRMRIALLANDLNGSLYVDTIFVRVTPSDTLRSITPDYQTIYLDSLQRMQQVNVSGLFSNSKDSVVRNISSGDAGTAYTPKTNGVFTVNADGVVSGLKAGVDTLIITNNGKTTKVVIRVGNGFETASRLQDSLHVSIPDKRATDLPFRINGRSSSGEPITYRLISGPVSIAGDMVTINAAGQVKLLASTLTSAYFKGVVGDTLTFNIQFALPVNNFKVSTNSVTCKGSANGFIKIAAVKKMNYTATVTSGTQTKYPFTDSLVLNNLAPGSYSVCITVDGQSDFRQCYTLVITEPKDLSLYVASVQPGNYVVIKLNGSATYHINLNGNTTVVNASQLTLSLREGMNTLKVYTDLACQGVIEKTIFVSKVPLAYPNPFTQRLNLVLGNTTHQSATVRIYSTNGNMVYNKTFKEVSDMLPLDLSILGNGVYMLKLTTDQSDTVFKIIKQ